MAIAALTAVELEERALERPLKERAHRVQARLAQQQTDAELERLRLRAAREQLRAQADAERQRQQRAFDTRTLHQPDASREERARVERQMRGLEPVAQHLQDEQVRIAGQNAYRAQTTPPPPSSMRDLLA